jgi:hypothetical protein
MCVVSGVAHGSEAPAEQQEGEASVMGAASGQALPRPGLEPPVQATPFEAPLQRRRRFGLRDVSLIVGLDRASSVAGYRSSISDDHGPDPVTRGVDAAIIGGTGSEAVAPFVLPRLSLDARLSSGLSLGMTFSYAVHGAERSFGDPGTDETLPSRESVLIGPRVGWLRPLSRGVALWLRGGPTWARHSEADSTSEPGETLTLVDRYWAMSLEPQLLFMPLSHVGFSVGGAFDLGLGGEHEVSYRGGLAPEVMRNSATMTTYGMSIGLFALF